MSDEQSNYRLVYDACVEMNSHSGCYAWDTLTKGQMFSTFDKDNDETPEAQCSVQYISGRWFQRCFDQDSLAYISKP